MDEHSITQAEVRHKRRQKKKRPKMKVSGRGTKMLAERLTKRG